MTALLSTTVVEAGPVAEGGALLAWRRFRRNRLALAGWRWCCCSYCSVSQAWCITPDQTSTDLAGINLSPSGPSARHRRRRT
jgi:hypothetical protein